MFLLFCSLFSYNVPFLSLLPTGLISLFLSLYCLLLIFIVLRSHIPISIPLLSYPYIYCPPVSYPYFYPSIVFLLSLLSSGLKSLFLSLYCLLLISIVSLLTTWSCSYLYWILLISTVFSLSLLSYPYLYCLLLISTVLSLFLLSFYSYISCLLPYRQVFICIVF